MRLPVAILAALAFAGCGADDQPQTAATTPTATATPTPPAEKTASPDPAAPPPKVEPKPVVQIGTAEGASLGFTVKDIDVDAGRLTLEMRNSGSIDHAIAIKGTGVDVQGALVGPGKVSRVEIKLKPGTYRFYCPVPGHAEGGMEGTLTAS